MAEQGDLWKSIDVSGAVMECRKAPATFAKKVLDEASQGDTARSIAYLVVLSTHRDKRYFNALFDQVIKSGEDLGMFLNACRSGVVRSGLGRSVKEAAARWLRSVPPDEIYEHSVKREEGRVGWGWFDFLKLLRPKPTTPIEQSKFSYMSTPQNPISREAVRRAIGGDDRILSRGNESFILQEDDEASSEDKIEELKRRIEELEESR